MQVKTIDEIAEDLRKGFYTQNPVGASEDLGILAGNYGWTCGQLEQILQRKPSIWAEIRKNVKSDTACERAWEQTSDGLSEMGLRLRLKGMDKMSSALKSLIRLAEAEIHNQL